MQLPGHTQPSADTDILPDLSPVTSTAPPSPARTPDPTASFRRLPPGSLGLLALVALIVVSSLPVAASAQFRSAETDPGTLSLPIGLLPLLAIWVVPALLVAVAATGSFLDALAAPAVSLALAGYLWGLATAPNSITPGRSAVFALALFATGSFAAWVGYRWGWSVTRRALVLGLGIVALGGLVSGVVGPEWALRPNVWEPWQVARLAGATAGPNQIGQFGGLLAIVSAVGIRRRPRPGAVAVAGLLLGSACVLWSQTRTAGGALILALVVLTVVRWRWRGMLWGLVATAIVAVTVVATISPTRSQLTRPVLRYQSVDKLLTLTERTGLWAVAVDDIAERPVTGWGAGAARRLYHDHWSAGEYETQAATVPTNSHNRLLDTAQTLGLVGAVLQVASLAVLVALILRRRRLELVPVVVYLLATSLAMPIPGLPTPVTLAWFAVLGAASTPVPAAAEVSVEEATVSTRQSVPS